jgi:hypothetical protein
MTYNATHPIKKFNNPKVHRAASGVIAKIGDTIAQLLREGIELPTWTSQNTDPFHEHINNLRIPVLSTTPSFLLHDLRMHMSLHDADVERRVCSVFSTIPPQK